MGRGTSKISGASRIAKVRTLSKDLTKAKAAVTKAEKNYHLAEGAVLMFDWNALTARDGRKAAQSAYNQRKKQARSAQKKYNDAIKKRNSIQGKINRLTRTNRSTSEEMPFF